jgi:hypothetical protein
MKKASKKYNILFTLLVVTIITALLSGCAPNSYGEVYEDLLSLKEAVSEEGMHLLYPTYMGETNEESESVYVLTNEDNVISGYKIYNFGSPYYVSVTAYGEGGGEIKSDNIDRLTLRDPILTDRGEAALYTGTGFKDALFLIAAIDIEGRRYEVRVKSDEEMEDNAYVNAIYLDNERYPEAISLIIQVIEGLEP